MCGIDFTLPCTCTWLLQSFRGLFVVLEIKPRALGVLSHHSFLTGLLEARSYHAAKTDPKLLPLSPSAGIAGVHYDA